MDEYIYWRITKIINRIQTSCVSVNYLNFNNNKNITLNKNNLIVSHNSIGDSSKTEYMLSKIGPPWTADTRNTLDVFISYNFEVPVKVESITISMRQNMADTWGQEWQFCSIECSNDQITWESYGYVVLNIAKMDVGEYTFPVNKNPAKVLNGNTWYNFIPNISTRFQLDYNSNLNEDGNIITFNGSSNSISSEGNVKNGMIKAEYAGPCYRNFNYKDNYIYKYKTIKINKTNWIFKDSINIPNEFTFILKTKVWSNSVFLNKALNAEPHGLVYDITSGNSGSYKYLWRIAGDYSAGQNYSYEERSRLSPLIDTVIVKGNITNKDVTFMTTYGIYKISPTSDAFNLFLTTNTLYSVIGYFTDNVFRPEADIIAYALYDANLTYEQLYLTDLAIDEQFLINKTLLSTQTSKIMTYKYSYFNTSVDTSNTKIKFNYTDYLRKKTLESINLIQYEINIKDTFIKEYKTIKDYVYEENTPVVTVLYLIERSSGILIAKTVSRQDGYFEFKNINKDLDYIVLSPDKKYQFKSVIKDYINEGNNGPN